VHGVAFRWAAHYDPGVAPSRFRPVVAAFWLLCSVRADAQTVVEPRLAVEEVASGLAFPTGMAFIGPDDILVVQKEDGRVRRILSGVLLPDPVLDVAVDAAGERGLLGIAVDPEFVINRHIFLYYTESSVGIDTAGQAPPLGNRVYRYTWDGSALGDPTPVLDLPTTPGPIHDGGVITFGPDGALYAVIGDLRRFGKLQNNRFGADADDTAVILRTDRTGAGLPDNPFFNPADPADRMNRYFAYGIRNSFGLAFDSKTGFLWDTENGPNVYDEVNRVVPGFDSGWFPLMGPDAIDPQTPDDLWLAPGATYRDPEFSWLLPVSPTALAFPSSPIMGCALQDDLVVGDNNCGQLYRFRLNASRDALAFSSAGLLDRVADNADDRCAGEMDEVRFGSGFGIVTDLENGPDGRLYVLSAYPGRLFRIGPRPGEFPDADADGVDDACDCSPGDAGSFARPPRIRRLGIASLPPRTVAWDPLAAASGSGTTYDVVSGDLTALRSDGGYASACTLRRGLTQPQFVDGRPDPPAGSAYYYLARGENACGPGSFGGGTSETDALVAALDAAPPPLCTCAARPGGALVTFRIGRESMTVWVTNGDFIDRALRSVRTGRPLIPVFNRLLDGADCDAQWSWHVDPQDVMFASDATGACDGLPSFVEGNKPHWLETVGAFCPRSAVVTAVEDHSTGSVLQRDCPEEPPGQRTPRSKARGRGAGSLDTRPCRRR